MRLALACCVGLAVVSTAAAAPPRSGVLEPGASLGGIRLGMTGRAVLSNWGERHGVCRGCRFPTWYFNYRPFEPEGAGVELRRGRVAAVFTLWGPRGWHATNGVRVGDPVPTGGIRVNCGTYYALTARTRTAVTATYVRDEKVWGFGLSRPSVPVCR